MSIRRAKLTRIERLLRGLGLAGRYGSPAVVAAMLGCVPEMQQISISPDGRYVVVAAGSNGAFVPYFDSSSGQGTMPHLVVLDLKESAVAASVALSKPAFWLSNVGQTAVFLSDEGEKAVVVLHTGEGKTHRIEDATLPSLSHDGKRLVYSKSPGSTSNMTGDLMLYDIATDKTTDLKAKGGYGQISPDGKRVLFAQRDAESDDAKWTLAVINIDGSGRKEISKIDPETGKLFVPRWVDDGSVIYRTRTEKSPGDGELFVSDLSGKVEQITDTDEDDVNPQVIGAGRIVYGRQATGEGDKGLKHAEVWVAEKKAGKWEHRALGIKAFAFAASGDRLIAVGDNEGKIVEASIADPSKTRDLSALIAKKFEGK